MVNYLTCVYKITAWVEMKQQQKNQTSKPCLVPHLKHFTLQFFTKCSFFLSHTITRKISPIKYLELISRMFTHLQQSGKLVLFPSLCMSYHGAEICSNTFSLTPIFNTSTCCHQQNTNLSALCLHNGISF